MKPAAAGLLLCGALIAPVSADDFDQDQVLQLRQAGVIVALEQILQVVYQRHPGSRLLEAELDEDDGELIYELELVTRDGRVRELEFNARDGSLLKDEED